MNVKALARKLSPIYWPIKVFNFFYVLVQRLLIWLFKPPPPPSDRLPQRVNGRIAVIGAGLTGISSAAHAIAHEFDVVIFEQNNTVGTGHLGTRDEAALAVPGDEGWRAVEVRHVWCDRSVWEATWTAWNLRWRLAEAREKGEALREVTSARLEGANHFVHWDQPESALAALLTDVVEKY